jgi:hypothetical protein
MKRITQNEPNKINIDNLSLKDGQIIAVKFLKGFPLILVNVGEHAAREGVSMFKWRDLTNLTCGFDEGPKELKKAILYMLNWGDDVFLFDNFKELMSWTDEN